jgi:hypothetical protein
LEWIERTPLIVIELHDWQGGWRGTGHAVFSGLSTHPRDYMQRGENMFSFAHHTALGPERSERQTTWSECTRRNGAFVRDRLETGSPRKRQ